VTTASIIGAIVFVIVMFAGAILGGIWGERMHRKADSVISSNREGGIVREWRVR